MKLRTQLSLSLTLVSSVTLALAFLAVFLVLRHERILRQNRALLARAHAAAQLKPKKLALLEPRLVVLYDGAGSAVAHTKGFAPTPPSYTSLGIEGPIPDEGVAFDLNVDARPLRGVLVPTAGGGRLLYAGSRAGLKEDLSLLTRAFLIALLIALVVTTLVSWLVGRRLSENVDAIVAVTRQVAGGDLAARLPEDKYAPDEIRRLRADLNHMIGELADLLRAQRTFISHAAHEIRSPLTTLQTELELGLSRERTGDVYREVIARALGEVQALIALAEDLLILARTQRAAQHEESTTVGAVIDEALAMARGRIEERGVRVVVRGEPLRAERVVGGGRELGRALRNLVDNAVEHSPAGATVTLEATRGPDQVRISVEDEGPGVAPADIPNIFLPFYRGANEPPSRGGAGLGLAIAREIARAAGGDIAFDPAVRSGARFFLNLRLGG